MEKIITQLDIKPIPHRNYDWEAFRYNYEAGDPIGYGKTESEAIEELKRIEEGLEDLAEFTI